MAASVMSLDDCMSASSAGDLIVRQALTSASPETISRPKPGTARAWSTMKKRVVHSTASGAAEGFARIASAISANGLWSSCQGRMSASISQRFRDRRHFEEGRHHDRLAARRYQRRRRSLRAPPADAGEVLERRTGLDEERGDLVPLHERLQFRDARGTLGGRDRRRAGDSPRLSLPPRLRRAAGYRPQAPRPRRQHRRNCVVSAASCTPPSRGALDPNRRAAASAAALSARRAPS